MASRFSSTPLITLPPSFSPVSLFSSLLSNQDLLCYPSKCFDLIVCCVEAAFWNLLVLVLIQMKRNVFYFQSIREREEGAAAALFTEGVLPYQCVCCHLLHCFSGQCILFSLS